MVAVVIVAGKDQRIFEGEHFFPGRFKQSIEQPDVPKMVAVIIAFVAVAKNNNTILLSRHGSEIINTTFKGYFNTFRLGYLC